MVDKETIRKWANAARKWANMLISLGVLIAMIFGVQELTEVNVNLKEIRAEKISTQEILLLNPNGTAGTVIFNNGTHTIIRTE